MKKDRMTKERIKHAEKIEKNLKIVRGKTVNEDFERIRTLCKKCHKKD